MTGDELKQWRVDRGYSQEELAKMLEVHSQTVYRWESEARAIPPFLPLALKTLESRKKPAPKK